MHSSNQISNYSCSILNKLYFLEKCLEALLILDLTKIILAGAELFHADGKT